ncbi:MAG TPA: alpha/beta fold hydrolase [Vicinamibacterales bacterium]|nr:alpha/beta fold hydrolase [Vicinamibacterales bacterium]
MTFAIRKVPVDGGDLRVGFRPGKAGAPVVVLVHGITANHLSWSLVADQLGEDATLLAPDLRGRAGSASLPGPFGMANHARDLLAVLDYIGVRRATVVGHSMGAYAAAAFAVNHDDRVAGLVLVDGGVSFATLPEGADIDAVLTALLGPTMKRLSMTFADVDAWLAYWKAHPSLQNWNDAIEKYVLADLAGVAPQLRSSCNVEAIRADGADTLGSGGQFFRRLIRPTPWLRAPRGLLNQVPGLYPDAVAAQICTDVPTLRDMRVDDVNHYTITMSEHGARVVADVIRTQM